MELKLKDIRNRNKIFRYLEEKGFKKSWGRYYIKYIIAVDDTTDENGMITIKTPLKTSYFNLKKGNLKKFKALLIQTYNENKELNPIKIEL